jgi:hypothetical protein
MTVLVETGCKHKVETGRWCAETTTRQTASSVSFRRWWHDDLYRRQQQIHGPGVHKFLQNLVVAEIAGSIPDSVIGIFHWHNPSGRTMALGSTQPLTEMRTRFLGGKGGRCVGLTTLPPSCRLSRNLGASTSCNLKGLSRPVIALDCFTPQNSGLQKVTWKNFHTLDTKILETTGPNWAIWSLWGPGFMRPCPSRLGVKSQTHFL